MLSAANTSASWLAARREEARGRLETLPFPARTEERWRYTDLPLLDPRTYGRAPGRGGTAPDAEATALLAGTSGRIVHVDSQVHELIAPPGVTIEGLEQAARDHGPLLQSRLGRLVGSDSFFAARSLAWHQGGTFLHVPAGTRLEAPVAALSWLTPASAGATLYPRTVVVVEREAEVVFNDLYLSAPFGPSLPPALVLPVVELFVEQGARVGWVTWHQWGAGVRHAARLRAHLARDAHLRALALGLGGDLSRTESEVVLAGEGSQSVLLGAYFPAGSERVEHWTLQEHQAPHTTSDLLYVGALAEEARSVYYGTIRVLPGARRADAYQANRNLMLSGAARADTNPQLEIENNDVRCTHGATVGPIDPQALFYLMSRGVPRAKAAELLVMGFFERLMDRMGWSGLEARMREALRRRLEAIDVGAMIDRPAAARDGGGEQ